jgi:hypothetical protein
MTEEPKFGPAKSPTEVLIDCMEEFGSVEPESVVVIILDEDGFIKWRVSRPLGCATILGMLELTKMGVLKNMEI